ncbi:pentapeptide repeat-containing protein [Chryseobacterium lathyri]|uniref:pentapeptide repeat-containing protein n=1 Tax=Chryseobacterium lathyri TaxID=395933 RepID=UPI002789ED70|nr:pentapeptide repeat-containing protein [Chryseobacterium lathyri]MDQ0067375.1 uncharacterized protein YjbI with pentapeptide repeats [Chryseobacterium lathyri]
MKKINNDNLNAIIMSYQDGAKSNIDNLHISDYIFENIKFEYTGLRNNIFENCVFKNIKFETVYFNKSTFKQCLFNNCEFESIDFGMHEVSFENTIFYETNYYKTDMLSSSFISTYFLKCNFIYFDISSNTLKNCRIINCNPEGLIFSPDTFIKSNFILD